MRNFMPRMLIIGLAFLLTAAGAREEKKSPAPEFILKDLDQAQVELASFKNKKPVVLFFWTTWCPYCQIALKNFQRDHADMANEGYEVLSINAGEPQAKVARFAKSNGLTFRIFLDLDSKVADDYQVYGVPAYFLVDKKGYLRSMDNSFPREKVRGLVKE